MEHWVYNTLTYQCKSSFFITCISSPGGNRCFGCIKYKLFFKNCFPVIKSWSFYLKNGGDYLYRCNQGFFCLPNNVGRTMVHWGDNKTNTTELPQNVHLILTLITCQVSCYYKTLKNNHNITLTMLYASKLLP